MTPNCRAVNLPVQENFLSGISQTRKTRKNLLKDSTNVLISKFMSTHCLHLFLLSETAEVFKIIDKLVTGSVKIEILQVAEINSSGGIMKLIKS